MRSTLHDAGPVQAFIECSGDPAARQLEYLRWLVQRAGGERTGSPVLDLVAAAERAPAPDAPGTAAQPKAA